MVSKLQKKQDKRKQIAKSTCGLFVEKGFVNISVSEIAKVAGIGKGTIYEYFENKEDIVFELMSCLQEDYDPKLEEKLKLNGSAKQKMIYLFDLFVNDTKEIQVQKKIYQEYLAIYLNNPSDIIIKYQQNMMDKYTEILNDIFNTAIANGDIIEQSINLVPSIFATMEGFFILGKGEAPMLNYIDSLFEILEKKGD